jgi:hypothetical protein
MASGGKKQTTRAKLNRESRLRDRRLEKQARKQARREASTHPAGQADDTTTGEEQQQTPAAESDLAPVQDA